LDYFAAVLSLFVAVFIISTCSLTSPGDCRHLQCQEGKFASSSEVDCYAGRATQASQVPTHQSDEVCPIMKAQKGLFKSATPTLLVLGANHSHTKQNNTDTKEDYFIIQNSHKL